MPWTRTAIATVVVCLAAASAASGDDGQRRRGRGRGHDARVIVHPRVVVRPPVVRHYAAPRVVPYGARLRYGPVYRPGLGIGIYIGSPYRYGYRSYPGAYHRTVPYGYYGQPYAYPGAYPYAYPPAGSVYAAPPPDALYGGVRLDVTPNDAAVYVDGYYAGIVDDFDGAWQRVALEPGPHRFEVVAPGYEPLTFEVNVRPSQTVRYRGDLYRAIP